MTFADCAVVIDPLPDQLADIAISRLRHHTNISGNRAAGGAVVVFHQRQRARTRKSTRSLKRCGFCANARRT